MASSPVTPKLTKTLLSPITSAEKSPKLRSPGTARSGFLHACTFTSLVRNWFDLQRKGIVVCGAVKELNLHELPHGEYPKKLKPLCESLTEIVKAMLDIIDSMNTLSKQCNALAKLESGAEPLFNTWSGKRLAIEMANLCSMVEKETEIKNIVKENVAHARDQSLIETYICSWEYNVSIDRLCLEMFMNELSID